MRIEDVPIRPPREWSSEWFQRWVYETLAPFLPGGDPDEGDVTDLIDASIVTSVPEGDLPNARPLIGQPGVLTTVDHGAGGSVEIRLEPGGVQLGHMAPIPGPSLLGNPFDSPQSPQTIAASADDTVARSVGGTVEFGQLTSGMFPSSLTLDIDFAINGFLGVTGEFTVGTGPVNLPNSSIEDAALSANVALYDGDVVSFTVGEFADGRISESSVTQHQATLEIDFDQLTGVPQIPGGLEEYADDAAADVGGIAVDGLYRTGSVVKIRVS